MNGPAVGQHLWIGVAGMELNEANRRLLHSIQPGGVVLFGRNVESAKQLRSFTRALKREIPSAPLIAIDHEGGRVNRLRPILGELPTVAELKKSGRASAARAFGRKTGQALRRLGIEVNFAPVLDLELFAADADNGLRDRCWGKTAAEVTRWAGAFIDGLQAAGIPACPKHFPGIGAALTDSHDRLPTIHRSRAELAREDVRVFAELLPRVGAVMVGHGHYPDVQGEKPQPASLSPVIVGQLLRRRLGFAGLVVTDDLEMGAVTTGRSIGEATVEALAAGADLALICHSPEKILSAHESLTRAVEAGRVELARLGEAQVRIRCFAARWACGKGSAGGEARSR